MPSPTKLCKSNTNRAPASRPSNLSRRQAKFLKNRLKKDGCRNLFEYLVSDHWWDLKERYRATVHLTGQDAGYRKRGLPQTCVVCRDKNVDLHHRTYARLGEEHLDDLVPLCRTHHDQLHDEGLDLWNGPGVLYRRERERRRDLGRAA
jgi:hypothetical protein